MKIKGQAVKIQASRDVVIPRPHGQEEIRLKVRAFALGFEQQAEELFPYPKAPRAFAMGKNKLPLFGADGKAVTFEDTSDPAYLAETKVSERRHIAFYVANGIIGEESDVQFETPRPPTLTAENAPAYFDAIYQELAVAGFSLGDLNIVIEAIKEVSNLRAEDIERAREGLSSGRSST